MENFFKRLDNNNSLSKETKRYDCGDYQNGDLTLNFVLSGIQHYKINRKDFIVHPDCFLVINKGTEVQSRIQSQDYVQSLSISFDPKFVYDMNRVLTSSTEQLLENPFHDTIFDFQFPEILLPLKSNLLFNVHHINHFIKNKLEDDHLLEQYLHHTFINYFEIFNRDILLAEDRLDCLKQHTKAELMRRLSLAKDFIYCNFDQQIELNAIAENSYLSVNHLLRTFKQAFGETPHQFLTRIRLKRANYLITNTNTSINEIVSAVGFDNSSSFIRLYRSHYNCTPAKYRKAS